MTAISAVDTLCKQADSYRLSFFYVPHSVDSPLNSYHIQHSCQSTGSSLLNLILLEFDITILTQQLCYFLYRIKTSMTAFCILNTFWFLGMVYRKLLDNANLVWFTDGSLKDKQESYQAEYAITSMVDITGSFYLPE